MGKPGAGSRSSSNSQVRAIGDQEKGPVASAHQEPCFLAPPDNPVNLEARCNRPYPRMDVGMHIVPAIDPYPVPGRDNPLTIFVAAIPPRVEVHTSPLVVVGYKHLALWDLTLHS